MKKVILLIGILTTAFSFSQNGSAYRQLAPVQDGISDALRRNTEIAIRNRQLEEERRQRTIGIFYEAKKNAITEFNQGNFSKCIYYYESSKGLGWYDAEFEYATGLSYYQLWKKLEKRKYKTKAKKLLKLAKKHGSIDASIFLDENL